MFQNIIKITIALIVIIFLAYGVTQSNFNNLKKYDEKDTSPIIASFYNTEVQIKDSGMVNLGDFTIRTIENKELRTNISIKIKNNKNNKWVMFKDIGDEVVEKGKTLRSSVIHTISGNRNASLSNIELKARLVHNMNNHLSDGEVEEVYFNKFIIQ